MRHNLAIINDLDKLTDVTGGDAAAIAAADPPCVQKLFIDPRSKFVIFKIKDLSMSNLMEILEQKQSLERQFDFHFETTFWEEFSIADNYGSEGVIEHYNLVFNQWKDNLRFLTELVLVLNWKIYQWYQGDDNLGMTYDELWKMTDGYALETLKGDDLHYYLSILD